MSAESWTCSDSARRREKVVLYLILNVQRTHLPVEELQGLHVAMSGCVVDSVGSALRMEEEEEEEDKKFQDIFYGITHYSKCSECWSSVLRPFALLH